MNEEYKNWLNIFLRSPSGRKEIESRATGNQQSMRNIGQKALLDIDLRLPGNNERKEIERKVGELLERATAVEAQYLKAKKRLDILIQSILARAFSGNLFLPFANTSAGDFYESKKEPTDGENKKTVDTVGSTNEKVERPDRSSESRQSSSPKKLNAEKRKFLAESSVLKTLKAKRTAQSAQNLLSAFDQNSFDTIDLIFSEVKELLALGVVEKVGEGEDCVFKVNKP